MVFFIGLVLWAALPALEVGSSVMFFSSLPLVLALWLQGRERRASKGQSTPPK